VLLTEKVKLSATVAATAVLVADKVTDGDVPESIVAGTKVWVVTSVVYAPEVVVLVRAPKARKIGIPAATETPVVTV